MRTGAATTHAIFRGEFANRASTHFLVSLPLAHSPLGAELLVCKMLLAHFPPSPSFFFLSRFFSPNPQHETRQFFTRTPPGCYGVGIARGDFTNDVPGRPCREAVCATCRAQSHARARAGPCCVEPARNTRSSTPPAQRGKKKKCWEAGGWELARPGGRGGGVPLPVITKLVYLPSAACCP